MCESTLRISNVLLLCDTMLCISKSVILLAVGREVGVSMGTNYSHVYVEGFNGNHHITKHAHHMHGHMAVISRLVESVLFCY